MERPKDFDCIVLRFEFCWSFVDFQKFCSVCVLLLRKDALPMVSYQWLSFKMFTWLHSSPKKLFLFKNHLPPVRCFFSSILNYSARRRLEFKRLQVFEQKALANHLQCRFCSELAKISKTLKTFNFKDDFGAIIFSEIIFRLTFPLVSLNVYFTLEASS